MKSFTILTNICHQWRTLNELLHLQFMAYTILGQYNLFMKVKVVSNRETYLKTTLESQSLERIFYKVLKYEKSFQITCFFKPRNLEMIYHIYFRKKNIVFNLYFKIIYLCIMQNFVLIFPCQRSHSLLICIWINLKYT